MNDSRPSRYEPFFSASRSGDIGRDVRSCEVLWLPRNLRSNRDMRLQQEGRVRFLGLPEARFDPFPYCLVPRGNEGRFLELSDLFVDRVGGRAGLRAKSEHKPGLGHGLSTPRAERA